MPRPACLDPRRGSDGGRFRASGAGRRRAAAAPALGAL